MSSGGVKTTASQKRAYIFMPKLLIDRLEENYHLEHGLIVKELNPCLNEGYLQVYFKEWGSITGCKVWRNPGEQKSMAYLRFATSDEADRADWAGPHIIGGTEVLVRRVVSPKTDSDADLLLNVKASSARPQPRRSISLGYILEDAQWLDDIVD
ncbi:uncharacterized protein LOC128751569 [Synchiropus splendidus]|uniref:uncharacterized protein LOC128751569 n=1 Tax=Synchiropus splendidus TaxID=270530 RepID=UPI00237EB09D|nr:uncharacterized protein LOC128751569 [Synchiropus splendidus]